MGDTGQAERKQKRVIDEHSGIRDLKHRWDEEDKTRDELERQARRAFLKQEANELFAPLENYLTRLDKVLHQANAAVEIDPTWEHLDERKLRRTAKVILREASLDRNKLALALPSLLDTADELEAVAAKLGASRSDIHLQRDASETTVKRAALGDYRVVYFATHGLLAGDVKGLGEPSLALTIPNQPSELDDGLLTASEVAQL